MSEPSTRCADPVPAILALFKRLTYLWAAVNALDATTSLALLLAVPVAAFVGIATVAAG